MTDMPKRYLYDEHGVRVGVQLDIRVYEALQAAAEAAAETALTKQLLAKYGDPALGVEENLARLEQLEDDGLYRLMQADDGRQPGLSVEEAFAFLEDGGEAA